MVTCDADHIYRNEAGEIYLSVTQHLQISGLVDFSMCRQEDLEYAAMRGQYVHEAVNMYLHDDLELEGLDDQYRGYVKAFIKFMKENKINACSSEEIVWSDELKTAGSYDFICDSLIFKGYGALFEIKTSASLPKTTGIQTAAYKLLYNGGDLLRSTRSVLERWSLLLNNKGTYRLKSYKETDDKIFKSIVRLNWWALSNGIIPVGARSNEKVYQLCKSIINGNLYGLIKD